MVSFAACFALRLSSQFAGHPSLAQSVRGLIGETADVLERIGTLTRHRNGISALYGNYLRHIVRKAAGGGTGETAHAAAVEPLHGAFQTQLGGHVGAAVLAAEPPIAAAQQQQPYMEASTPWSEQFQLSAMSDDQMMEALSRVGNEFDANFAGFSWEDTPLDWMDWSNLPEYRI
jgi:hypothetical protein